MKKISELLWGLVFIALGVILGLNALEITNIELFFDGWWTLFIIIPCFIGLFNDSDKTGNLIGLLIGLVLLLSCQDFIEFEMVWKLIIPIVLVVIGLSFIFRGFINSKVKSEIKKLNDKKKNTNEYCATFSSQNVDFSNDEFDGADLSAVFGGVKCDLRKATIKDDKVINATAIFGGIKIYVPKDVNIKIKSTPIFGGVSNETINDGTKNEHTIYVNATSVFGGVEIK